MPVVVADSSGDGALVGQVYSVSKTSAIVGASTTAVRRRAQLVQETAFGPKGTASGQARRPALLRDRGQRRGDDEQGDVITLGGGFLKAYRGLVIGKVAHSVAVGRSVAATELRPVVTDRLDVVKV
jgi:hypothetical protein